MKHSSRAPSLTSSLTSSGANSGAHERTVADGPEVKTATTDVGGRLRTALPEPPFEGSNPSAPASGELRQLLASSGTGPASGAFGEQANSETQEHHARHLLKAPPKVGSVQPASASFR